MSPPALPVFVTIILDKVASLTIQICRIWQVMNS